MGVYALEGDHVAQLIFKPAKLCCHSACGSAHSVFIVTNQLSLCTQVYSVSRIHGASCRADVYLKEVDTELVLIT